MCTRATGGTIPITLIPILKPGVSADTDSSNRWTAVRNCTPTEWSCKGGVSNKVNVFSDFVQLRMDSIGWDSLRK